MNTILGGNKADKFIGAIGVIATSALTAAAYDVWKSGEAKMRRTIKKKSSIFGGLM